MSDVSVDASESTLQADLPPSSNRRKFLTVATSVVGAVGAGFATVPFIASWQPSERAKAAGADVEVDISGLQVGQLIRVMWRSKPVWIVKRSQAVLDALSAHEDELADPNSEAAQQPDYAANIFRSRKEDIIVLVGICTHLGCSPQHLADGAMEQYAEGVKDGFFCPCHGSKFDMSGRVFSGVPAGLNLQVPPYGFISENTILIGSDGEGVA